MQSLLVHWHYHLSSGSQPWPLTGSLDSILGFTSLFYQHSGQHGDPLEQMSDLVTLKLQQLNPVLTSLQHTALGCYSNTPGTLLPLYLYTYGSLCLEGSIPGWSYDLLLYLLPRFAQRPTYLKMSNPFHFHTSGSIHYLYSQKKNLF